MYKPFALKLLTNLRFGLKYLRFHKCNYNLSYCLHGFCIFLTNIECKNHFLHKCPLHLFERQSLTAKICDIDNLPPFGSNKHKDDKKPLCT